MVLIRHRITHPGDRPVLLIKWAHTPFVEWSWNLDYQTGPRILVGYLCMGVYDLWFNWRAYCLNDNFYVHGVMTSYQVADIISLTVNWHLPMFFVANELLPVSGSLQSRTVVAENLPEDHSIESMEQLFGKVGKYVNDFPHLLYLEGDVLVLSMCLFIFVDLFHIPSKQHNWLILKWNLQCKDGPHLSARGCQWS